MTAYCPEIPGLPRKGAFDILPGGHSLPQPSFRETVSERGVGLAIE